MTMSLAEGRDKATPPYPSDEDELERHSKAMTWTLHSTSAHQPLLR